VTHGGRAGYFPKSHAHACTAAPCCASAHEQDTLLLGKYVHPASMFVFIEVLNAFTCHFWRLLNTPSSTGARHGRCSTRRTQCARSWTCWSTGGVSQPPVAFAVSAGATAAGCASAEGAGGSRCHTQFFIGAAGGHRLVAWSGCGAQNGVPVTRSVAMYLQLFKCPCSKKSCAPACNPCAPHEALTIPGQQAAAQHHPAPVCGMALSFVQRYLVTLCCAS